MSEIKTPLLELENTETGEKMHVITEEHTFSDIIRYLYDQGLDMEDLCTLAKMVEDEES